MQDFNLQSNINVGETLKKIRENKGLSQVEVQQQLPYVCYLSKIEQNKSRIDFNMLVDILAVLKTSIDEFMEIGNRFTVQIHQFIQEKMSNNAFNISKYEVQKYLTKFDEHFQEHPCTNKHSQLHLLYCKLKCFYYLNFEQDHSQAKEYADVIMNYLFSTQYNYTIQDIELAVIAMAFCSFEEAQIITTKAQFMLDQAHSTAQHELHTRFLLASTKNLLLHEKYDTIPHKIQDLEKQMLVYPSAKFRSEVLLLKGYGYIKLAQSKQKDSLEGINLLIEGLQLARRNQETVLHQKWSLLCKKFFDIT